MQPSQTLTSKTLLPTVDTYATVQYIIAGAIFYLYGVQVCPFLDNLETSFLTQIIAALFTSLLLIRHCVFTYRWGSSPNHYAKAQLMVDMALFAGGGLILALGNMIVFGFPIGASFRVMFGFIFLGYFVSLQLTLKTENNALKNKQEILNKSQTIQPIGQKVRFVIFSLLIGAIVSLLMLMWKDLEWLSDIGNSVSMEQAVAWILYEFLFVCGVFCGYGIIITQYLTKNLSLSFEHQHEVLKAVKDGARNTQVPVTSNDEFRYLAENTNHMLASLKRSEETLNATRDASIYAISSLAETRDNETGAHIVRTQKYIKAICLYLKDKPKFMAYLSDERIALIVKSAPLHDIGKVGIPDSILLKPGKLTDEEFAIMKGHPLIGKQAIEKAEQQSGKMPFLEYAKEISESHHEKWDGSGYPYGLKGEDIPLSGRLMALADVYDALITQRVYKPAFSHEKSKAIILDGKGAHFDPDIVDAFLAVEAEFISIAQAHKDQ